MQCRRSGKPKAGGLSRERKARGYVVFRDTSPQIAPPLRYKAITNPPFYIYK